MDPIRPVWIKYREKSGQDGLFHFFRTSAFHHCMCQPGDPCDYHAATCITCPDGKCQGHPTRPTYKAVCGYDLTEKTDFAGADGPTNITPLRDECCPACWKHL